MVVDGEMVKPDFIIGLKWPGETLLSLIQGSKSETSPKGNIQSSGMKSGNIFVNLSQYFMVILIGMTGILILGILGFIFKSKREMIKEKLMNFKKEMVWSGIIKSLKLSYLGICIAISASFQSNEAIIAMNILNAVMILILFSIPVMIAIHSVKNFNKFRISQREGDYS
jgi:hypothetical protein